MILIYPPVSKPCEPPAGIGRISGSLHRHGVKHRVLDANIEGLLYLASSSGRPGHSPADTWTRRALRNLPRNLKSLKDKSLYRNFDQYKRTVIDVNKAIEISGVSSGVTIGLANYQHSTLSPLRSADLIRAAETPEENLFFPYFGQRLTRLLNDEQPSVAGFSLNYLSQAICAFAMAGFLKKICPEIKLVFGGGLVTSWAQVSGHKNRFSGLIDHLVAGPGERRLLSILGIDEIREDVSTPDYSALPLDDYLSPGLVLPYNASTGCHWNKCSFCPEKAEGNQYVPVSVSRVKKDINALVKAHPPVLIHFLDNSIRTGLLKAIVDDPPGVPWYGFTRISNRLSDPDFCISLKRSGCVMLKIGLESGDQSLLDQLHKGIDLETASGVLKALKKAGIAAYVYLLFGTPAETLIGARKTLEYTVRHSNEISFLNLAIFNMPLSWKETEDIKTTSFYEGDLSLYTNFSHPTGWDRREVRLFLENEFKKDQAVSSILKKDPPFFTSNHAPFFVM